MSIPWPEDKPLMSADETHVAIGWPRSSVYAAMAAGELPTVRLGRRVWIPTAGLRQLLGLPLEPEASFPPGAPLPGDVPTSPATLALVEGAR